MPPQDPELSLWFAEHVHPHEPMLRAWMRSQFPLEDDLDDLMQECFVRILRARERGNILSPRAFLFATARNLALDRIDRRRTSRSEPLVESIASSVLEEGADVHEIVARNQELELLTEAIQSLPDRCRQIFTLRKVFGVAQKEIVRRMGISENTVSAQLTIGVEKCAHFLEHCRREREGRRQ